MRARIDATVPAALAPWVLTVLHHAHWGVDLFFVLSGFSLAQPLLVRLSRSSPADPDPLAWAAWGRSFFVRRAARLYPAYLAALALVVAAVPNLTRHPSFPASALAHLTLLQGYFLPGGLAIIGAAWSLSTEVSFYLAWPLLAPRLLAAPSPRGATPPPASPEAPSHRAYTSNKESVHPPARAPLRPWRFGLALVALVWLVRAALHELALHPTAPPWLLEASQRRWAVSRLDQFVLGALAAAAHARLTRPPSPSPHSPSPLTRVAPLLVALSALALPGAFFLEGTFHGRPLGAWPYALVSLATTALVLSAASCGEAASRWLFPRHLRFVGVVSYGVFLNHQLALGATAHLTGPAGSWSALGAHATLGLALSLALGGLSWVSVERPVIEWASRLTKSGR